ncbi:MAG TPA: acyltransferase [Microthrixaceae bacterium]|nr:acyltransferase [Microthrixaceae bacterium]
MTERKLGYRPGLDGIRSVAIGLVLLNHTGLSIFEGGGNGVILFFVLSGFLITKLMIEEWGRTDRVSIGGFYGRRAVRILPAPTVMLITLFLLRDVITDTVETRAYLMKELLLSATYTMNMRPLLAPYQPVIDGEPFLGYLGHMWSLAVEEQFYLVWPLLMVSLLLPFASRLGVRAGVPLKLTIAAATITVVRLCIYFLPFVNSDIASIAVFSFDGFALGAALAFALHYGSAPRLESLLAQSWVPWAALAVLFADLLAGRWTHDVTSVYVAYTSIASAALIGHIMVAPDSMLSKAAAMALPVYIGKLSYSIYLWHNPIWVYVSSSRFDLPLVTLTLIEWSATAVIVLISYYGIEKPALKLRHRFVR